MAGSETCQENFTKQTTTATTTIRSTRTTMAMATTKLTTKTWTIKRYSIKPTERPTIQTSTTQYKFEPSLHFLENSTCSKKGNTYSHFYLCLHLLSVQDSPRLSLIPAFIDVINGLIKLIWM